MKLDFSKVEFQLNFYKKNLSGKICIKLDIVNIEFQNKDTDLNSFKKVTCCYYFCKIRAKPQYLHDNSLSSEQDTNRFLV